MNQDIIRGKQVLLVDDEECVRQGIRMLLEVDGHEVVEAANGAQALELLKQQQFDLVITDFRMEGMNGAQLAVRIKDPTPSQPILMLTGHYKEVPAKAVDIILEKPFTFAALRLAIAKLLA